MLLEGLINLGGVEAVNNARVVGYLSKGRVPDVNGFPAAYAGMAFNIGPYNSPADNPAAPWYVASRPESAEFLGFLLDVRKSGLLLPVMSRQQVARITGGVSLQPLNRGPIQLACEGLLFATSERGGDYGMWWLEETLALDALADLVVYRAPGQAADKRTLRFVGLTAGPSEGAPDEELNRCNIRHVSFVLASEQGWFYQDPTTVLAATVFQVPAAVTGSPYSQAILDLSPKGFWKQDDAAGATMTDSSAAGHNGTYVGGPTLNQTAIVPTEAGVGANRSAVFNSGGAKYATVADSADWDQTAFTLIVWFKSANPSEYLVARETLAGGGQLWEARIDSSGRLYMAAQFSDGGASVASPGRVDDNAVHMAVLTIQSGVNMYLDGAFVQTAERLGTLGTSDKQIDVAAQTFNGITFATTLPITLDDIAFIPSVLSAAQIADLYAKGVAAAGSGSAATDPIATSIVGPAGYGDAVGRVTLEAGATASVVEVKVASSPSAPTQCEPGYVTTGTAQHATTAATTLVIAHPVFGIGSAADDVLVAVVYQLSNTAPNSVPAGWTQFVNSDDPGNGQRMFAYWHRMATGDPANWTWGWAGATTARGVIMPFRGADPTNPMGNSTSQINTTGNPVAPSVTPNAADPASRLVCAFGIKVATTFTPPDFMVEQDDGQSGASTLEVADEMRFSSAATGTRTATAASSAARSIGASILVRPPGDYVVDSDFTVTVPANSRVVVDGERRRVYEAAAVSLGPAVFPAYPSGYTEGADRVTSTVGALVWPTAGTGLTRCVTAYLLSGSLPASTKVSVEQIIREG